MKNIMSSTGMPRKNSRMTVVGMRTSFTEESRRIAKRLPSRTARTLASAATWRVTRRPRTSSPSHTVGSWKLSQRS